MIALPTFLLGCYPGSTYCLHYTPLLGIVERYYFKQHQCRSCSTNHRCTYYTCYDGYAYLKYGVKNHTCNVHVVNNDRSESHANAPQNDLLNLGNVMTYISAKVVHNVILVQTFTTCGLLELYFFHYRDYHFFLW